jgi:hypothetical protein
MDRNQEIITALVAAENELREAGLSVDDPTEGVHNADILKAFFDSNPQAAMTPQNIRAACMGVLKAQLHWLDSEQVEFNKIWAILSSTEQAAFTAWQRPRRLINNLSNNLAVLRYLKLSQKYTVDSRTLLQASADRIAASLEWEAAPIVADPRQHTSSGAPKEDPRYHKDGRRNHAYREPGSKKEAPKNSTPDAWETMANKLANQGVTHSQQAAFRQTLEQGRVQGKSYRQIYTDLSDLKKSYERGV